MVSGGNSVYGKIFRMTKNWVDGWILDKEGCHMRRDGQRSYPGRETKLAMFWERKAWQSDYREKSSLIPGKAGRPQCEGVATVKSTAEEVENRKSLHHWQDCKLAKHHGNDTEVWEETESRTIIWSILSSLGCVYTYKHIHYCVCIRM